MKMKNIAFFGVMASILSVAGANAAGSGTTPTTIIATKAYVDNQVGDLDSTITADTNKVLKGVTITDGKLTGKTETTLATVATSGSYNDLSNKPTIPGSADFVSNGSNALDLSASTTKAPSVTAVQGMKTTSIRTKTTGTGDDVAVDTKVPTEKAVATALATKQNTITDLETIRTDASAGAGAATTISGYGNIVTHNTSEFATSTQGGKADTAVQTIKKNGTAVTKTDGVVDISVPTKVSQLTNDSSFATTTQVSTAKSEAISGAAGGTYSATGTYSSGTIGKALQGKQDALTTDQLNAVNSGITSGKVSTYDGYANGKENAGVAAGLVNALDLTTVSATGKPIVSVGQENGQVSAAVGTITDAGVATGADILYTKMKAPTATINGGTAECSASAPCVLSYDGSSYSWTTFAY